MKLHARPVSGLYSVMLRHGSHWHRQVRVLLRCASRFGLRSRAQAAKLVHIQDLGLRLRGQEDKQDDGECLMLGVR